MMSMESLVSEMIKNRIKYVYANGAHLHTVVMKQIDESDPFIELYVDGVYLQTYNIVSLAMVAYNECK